MIYDYRNIDSDRLLLKAAKMYWDEQITQSEMYDILANDCYSKWEADKAINDYYYVYVWPKILINRMLILVSTITIIWSMLVFYYNHTF